MKPSDGKYRLTSTNPTGYVATVTVAGNELTTWLGFGPMTWVEANDWFTDGKTTIRCTGEGTFSAVVNFGQPNQQVYEGTCTKIP